MKSTASESYLRSLAISDAAINKNIKKIAPKYLLGKERSLFCSSWTISNNNNEHAVTNTITAVR